MLQIFKKLTLNELKEIVKSMKSINHQKPDLPSCRSVIQAIYDIMTKALGGELKVETKET